MYLAKNRPHAPLPDPMSPHCHKGPAGHLFTSPAVGRGSVVQQIPLGVTYWKAQSSKLESSKLESLFCHVSMNRDVWALSFETAFENVTPSGIGCTVKVTLRIPLSPFRLHYIHIHTDKYIQIYECACICICIYIYMYIIYIYIYSYREADVSNLPLPFSPPLSIYLYIFLYMYIYM